MIVNRFLPLDYFSNYLPDLYFPISEGNVIVYLVGFLLQGQVSSVTIHINQPEPVKNEGAFGGGGFNHAYVPGRHNEIIKLSNTELKSNINSVLIRIKNYVEDEEAILLLMLKLLDIENIQEKKIEKIDEEELIINMLSQLL